MQETYDGSHIMRRFMFSLAYLELFANDHSNAVENNCMIWYLYARYTTLHDSISNKSRSNISALTKVV